MTKTELKKQQVKAALDFLESFDNVEIEDNGDGGRMSIVFGSIMVNLVVVIWRFHFTNQ